MTFHTEKRWHGEVKENSWVVWMPLALLAIPSALAGKILIYRMLYATPTLLANSVFVRPEHQVMPKLAEEYHGAVRMALEAGLHPTFWLVIAGILTAWFFTAYRPAFAGWIVNRFKWVYAILVRKFGFDDFNQIVLVNGTRDTGRLFYDVSDTRLIDGLFVNGSGALVRWVAKTVRKVQTGYLYHYALVMVLGMVGFLIYFAW